MHIAFYLLPKEFTLFSVMSTPRGPWSSHTLHSLTERIIFRVKWAFEYYFKKALACRVKLAMDLCSVQGRRWSVNRCRVCWITATSAGNGLQLQTGVVNSCQANYRACLETLNNMTHMWKVTFLTFAFSSKNFLNWNCVCFPIISFLESSCEKDRKTWEPRSCMKVYSYQSRTETKNMFVSHHFCDLRHQCSTSLVLWYRKCFLT